MNLLELSILTSAAIIGFKIVTGQGMLLSELGVLLESFCNKYPKIMTPIYSCHYCMASVWSIVAYSWFMTYTLNSIYELSVMMLAVCCFNGALFNISYNIWE